MLTTDGSCRGWYCPMISMKRPSRGLRPSATTTRYVGCFFLPTRIRRILTANEKTPTRGTASDSRSRRREAGNAPRGQPRRFRTLRTLALRALGALLLQALGHAVGARHRLHHLLHLLELLQQVVDLRRRDAA